jgi:hypothetical protein
MYKNIQPPPMQARYTDEMDSDERRRGSEEEVGKKLVKENHVQLVS